MSDGLVSNDVWCIYEDKDDNIWIGSEGGLCRYNSSSSSDSGLHLFSTIHITEFQDSTLINVIPSIGNAVWSILQDKSGNYWFGTSEGVFRSEGKMKPFEQTRFSRFLSDTIINEENLHLKYIQSMIEDKNGNIWFASWNQEGVCRFDGKKVTSYKPDGDGMIHALLEDKSGNIWIGSRNHGACYYDGKVFRNFEDREHFNSACINSIAEDIEGKIWFGTEPSGAWSFNPADSLMADSKGFTQFTMENGLSNNSVFSVTADASGKIWFGTRGIGLCSYDGKTFIRYTD
jgi:ligand-binding sensor domain-containing protein